MPHRIVIDYDPEIDRCSAVCPVLPGCASAGDTESKARRNIEEAIRLYRNSSDRTVKSAQAAQARHQRARNSVLLPGRSESVVRVPQKLRTRATGAKSGGTFREPAMR